MSRLKGSPTCLDCGVLHGRTPQAALCRPCRDSRQQRRRDTPRYRAMQARWNRSAKAKIVKGRWYERHGAAQRAIMRARYAAEPKTPHIVKCATLLCEQTFVRTRPGTRKLFCDPCAAVHHGRWYLRRRQRGAA